MKRVHIILLSASLVITVIAALVGAFFTTSNFVCVLLSGIAGSVISTALTNWILTKRFEHLPITSIIHALADRTKFARKDQKLKLEFRLTGDEVVVHAVHTFQLFNPSFTAKRRLVSIFTDAPRWSRSSEPTGFTLVRDSGGTLQGEELKKYLRDENSKQCFEKDYVLPPGDSIAFTFHILERYRLRDRMMWTIQDLSSDLHITLVNYTGRSNPFNIKLHHHNESEVLKQIRTEAIEFDGREETTIEFDSEILPFQGFEIMWDFTPPPAAQLTTPNAANRVPGSS